MFESNGSCVNLKRLKNKILGLDPFEFEAYIATIFERHGYDVTITPQSNDGGKDLILRCGSRKYYVECKHFIGHWVGREILQKLAGAAAIDGGVDACIIVTTSYFNENVLKAAENSKTMPIFLLDLEDICYLDNLQENIGIDIFFSETAGKYNMPNENQVSCFIPSISNQPLNAFLSSSNSIPHNKPKAIERTKTRHIQSSEAKRKVKKFYSTQFSSTINFNSGKLNNLSIDGKVYFCGLHKNKTD